MGSGRAGEGFSHSMQHCHPQLPVSSHLSLRVPGSYWMRFLFWTWFELPVYAARHSRYGLSGGTLVGESLYWAVVAALWRYNPVATLWTLVLPLVVSTLLLSFGNWWVWQKVRPQHDRHLSTEQA